MMSLFFTLGSTVHDWGWPKNGQTWQACQRSKVVNLSLFEHLGPFWTISNKNWYFAPKHLCKTLYCPFGAKISSPALTLVCDCVGRCSWLWFSEVKLARLATTLAMICQMGNRFLSSPVRWFHYVTVDLLLEAPNSGQQYWLMAPPFKHSQGHNGPVGRVLLLNYLL